MSRLLKQLLVLVLVACGNSPFLCAGSNPDDSGYTIGTILDSPPYSFLDEDGQPAGYDVDLTRAMARSMGLEVEIVIGPWEELRRDLENGSIDAIAGMYYSEQRDRQVDFSTPYIISHHTFFIREGDPPIKEEQDVSGKEVIVLRGGIMHEYILENRLNDNPVLVDTPVEALSLLASGQHDCAILARIQGLYWKKELNLRNIVTSGPLMSPAQAGFAVREGDAVLQQLISEGLTTLGWTGEHKVIYDKWLGVLEPPGFSAESVWRVIKVSSVIVLLLIIFFVSWFLALRKQVASRTRALKESEERFRELAEMLPDGVFETDADFRLTYVNQRVEGMSGYSAGELLDGMSSRDLIDPDDRNRFQLFHDLWAEGENPGPAEYKVSRKDGTSLTVLIHAGPIMKDGQLSGFRGIILDITRQKREEEEKARLEAQYQQGQKEESLGRLAGGVAHDLNNLLTPILGYSEILQGELEGDERLGKSLDQILKAGSRARDLVSKLLAFGRKQALNYQPVDLNQVLHGFEDLLRRTIREDVKIEMNTCPEKCLVLADSGQLEQVLLNLAVNARDAMPKGGVLRFQTELPPREQLPPAIRGDSSLYTMLSVEDTGFGMDEETLKHIFEPFYSTKGSGGTGLGLATVHGIVMQHNGNIQVESRSGEGTVFRIYLPYCTDILIDGNRGKREGVQQSGTETILIVEDNEQVRDLTSAGLSRSGYKVLVAENGPEALEVLNSEEEVHMLLSDVVLPGMNGRELYEKVAEKYPGMKVLYMSGYSSVEIERYGIIGEDTNFIQKPFTGRDLAIKVRELLDG